MNNYYKNFLIHVTHTQYLSFRHTLTTLTLPSTCTPNAPINKSTVRENVRGKERWVGTQWRVTAQLIPRNRIVFSSRGPHTEPRVSITRVARVFPRVYANKTFYRRVLPAARVPRTKRFADEWTQTQAPQQYFDLVKITSFRGEPLVRAHVRFRSTPLNPAD